MSYGAILEKDFSEYASEDKSSITLPLEKAIEEYNDWPNPGPLANLFYFSHSIESLF
jgi:hypothetical protein